MQAKTQLSKVSEAINANLHISHSYTAQHDGNGNVSGLVNALTGVLTHTYEYDPFGNVVSGQYDGANHFRHATKYQDLETGYYRYTFRYFNAEIGRWNRRDDIGAAGGLNLYSFNYNDAISWIDLLGNAPIKGGKKGNANNAYQKYIDGLKSGKYVKKVNPKKNRKYRAPPGPYDIPLSSKMASVLIKNNFNAVQNAMFSEAKRHIPKRKCKRNEYITLGPKTYFDDVEGSGVTKDSDIFSEGVAFAIKNTKPDETNTGFFIGSLNLSVKAVWSLNLRCVCEKGEPEGEWQLDTLTYDAQISINDGFDDLSPYPDGLAQLNSGITSFRLTWYQANTLTFDE